MERPTLELADLVRDLGDDFRTRHGSWLTGAQQRALRDVARCRTAALGGHVERCGGCAQTRIAYNSCRNRHCPKCLAGQQAVWLAREAEALLPVEYHHVVFALPDAVNPLAQRQPALVYNALFRAAAETIQVVAANPKHLGAQVGLLLVLHTWGQQLQLHPHVHGVVTGGGLSCDARGRVEETPTWRSCRPGFFLPVRVLSRVFRGKFLALLAGHLARGALTGWTAATFAAWRQQVSATDWVVYSQPPFAGPAVVLKYLARYTHRVAIGNRRLVEYRAGWVSFTYKDYRDAAQEKVLTLAGVEFLRRWVQHVLPAGFVKIRHYGLLANRQRAERLALCRRMLWPAVAVSGVTILAVEPWTPEPCAVCGGSVWFVVERFGRGAAIPACGAATRCDSS